MDSNGFAAWRKRVGITQEELAERWARVTRTTIQNWEGGATPIPQAVETACAIWERRLKQENPGLGPVTLIFADGPMFVDPYGPRRRMAIMHQEPYPSNTAAIARVLELSGRDSFHNPFILEKSGEDLWNAAELNRVARGEDTGAPTLVNLLRRLAKHVKETSAHYARSGPKMPSRSEAKAKQECIEALAAQILNLADAAADGGITYPQVEERLSGLRALGKFAPDSLVFGIAQAFGSRI
jgi:DNA-binding XRE family transcriptional regulator